MEREPIIGEDDVLDIAKLPQKIYIQKKKKKEEQTLSYPQIKSGIHSPSLSSIAFEDQSFNKAKTLPRHYARIQSIPFSIFRRLNILTAMSRIIAIYSSGGPLEHQLALSKCSNSTLTCIESIQGIIINPEKIRIG